MRDWNSNELDERISPQRKESQPWSPFVHEETIAGRMREECECDHIRRCQRSPERAEGEKRQSWPASSQSDLSLLSLSCNPGIFASTQYTTPQHCLSSRYSNITNYCIIINIYVLHEVKVYDKADDSPSQSVFSDMKEVSIWNCNALLWSHHWLWLLDKFYWLHGLN